MPGVCDVSHVDAISNVHDYVIDSCKIAVMMYMYYISRANSTGLILNIWFQLNRLTLNVDKTKCMLFHKRRDVTPINISMNNMPIDIVPHFNHLGIILDENLLWKVHIAMVTGKLSKINGILNRLKYIYPHKYYLQYINHCLFHIVLILISTTPLRLSSHLILFLNTIFQT